MTSGFVDLQINGVDAIDFSVAHGGHWVRAGQRLLAAGVTGYLPTICSMPLDRYAGALGRVAAAQAERGDDLPRILGVHLEGPFLGGALGAHPAAMVRPMDVPWLTELVDAFPVRFVPERRCARNASTDG